MLVNALRVPIENVQVTKKTFFVKIELYGKNVKLLNVSENTKENIINFPD